jgi:outer membrane protein TolC
LTSAVDLALRHSPRIKMSEADVQKARAALAETKDVFIPSFSAGAGLGQSFGYSPNPPTLFFATGQSVIYTASQLSYIKSARLSFTAAKQQFLDVREAVAEDVALTYSDLLKDQQREAALEQQVDDTARLVAIIEDRVNAGRDAHIDLTQARLNAANLRVVRLHARDDTLNDQKHLADLIGEPAGIVHIAGAFPTNPLPIETLQPEAGYANAAVSAAFLTAQARQKQAYADSRFLYRPSVSSFVQYNRYATFTNSFQQLSVIDAQGNRVQIGANQYAFGFQFNLPLFDRARRDHNRESIMDASHALHEAEQAQTAALDGQSRLRHSLEELSAQAEAATLAQQLAQEQLEIVDLELKAPVSGTPALTPKEQQNARIAERERFLTVVDANYQLRQAQIQLMRQTGRLIEWLTDAGFTAPPPPPIPTLKKP